MIEVELTPFEIRAAQALAKQRTKDNKKNDIRDRLQSGQDATFEGCCAELAVAKILNVYPDLQSGDYKAGDLKAFGGTVDVKWNHKGEYMNCPRWKNTLKKRCDYYFGVSGEPPNMMIHGWASWRELFSDENLHDIGNGPYYRLSLDSLHKLTRWEVIGG